MQRRALSNPEATRELPCGLLEPIKEGAARGGEEAQSMHNAWRRQRTLRLIHLALETQLENALFAQELLHLRIAGVPGQRTSLACGAAVVSATSRSGPSRTHCTRRTAPAGIPCRLGYRAGARRV